MRKLKRAAILVLAMALVLGAVPAAVLAGPGPTAHGPLMSLGLSDQQLAQIRDLEKHTYNQNRKLKIQMMDTKFALSQLRLQKNVDQAAVDAKVKELQDLRGQMKNNGLAARQKMQTILTPEQWNKLQAAGKECHHRGDRPAEPGDGT